MLVLYLFGGFVGGDNFRKKHLPSTPVLARRVYVRLAQLLDPLNRLPSRRTRTLPSIEAFIERIVLNAGKGLLMVVGISMNKNTFGFPCSLEEIGPSRTQMVHIYH